MLIRLAKSLAIGLAACMLTAGGHAERHGTQPNSREYYETRGDVVWEVPMDDKQIALTFDDGPDPIATPRILDLLAQYDAKATFFVIGKRADKFPNIVLREAAEGHEVSNHTYTHLYLNGRFSEEKLTDELQRTQKTISALSGQHSRLFRPPGGFYNDAVIRIAKRNRYTVVLWSWHQDTKDWTAPGTRTIVDKVLRNARNGDIVLLHDYVVGSTQTVEALEQILPELKKRGYRMVTVSQLMQHKVAASKNLK